MATHKVISNEHRTLSLSIPSVEMEAAGGQEVLGFRTVGQKQIPIGFATNEFTNDPLDILISEEDDNELI